MERCGADAECSHPRGNPYLLHHSPHCYRYGRTGLPGHAHHHRDCVPRCDPTRHHCVDLGQPRITGASLLNATWAGSPPSSPSPDSLVGSIMRSYIELTYIRVVPPQRTASALQPNWHSRSGSIERPHGTKPNHRLLQSDRGIPAESRLAPDLVCANRPNGPVLQADRMFHIGSSHVIWGQAGGSKPLIDILRSVHGAHGQFGEVQVLLTRTLDADAVVVVLVWRCGHRIRIEGDLDICGTLRSLSSRRLALHEVQRIVGVLYNRLVGVWRVHGLPEHRRKPRMLHFLLPLGGYRVSVSLEVKVGAGCVSGLTTFPDQSAGIDDLSDGYEALIQVAIDKPNLLVQALHEATDDDHITPSAISFSHFDATCRNRIHVRSNWHRNVHPRMTADTLVSAVAACVVVAVQGTALETDRSCSGHP